MIWYDAGFVSCELFKVVNSVSEISWSHPGRHLPNFFLWGVREQKSTPRNPLVPLSGSLSDPFTHSLKGCEGDQPQRSGDQKFTLLGSERIWRRHAAVLLPCYLSWTLHFWMSHGALKWVGRKKTGPMWAQQCDVCVWSPMFFFCGDPCGRSIMDCQVVMCNYFFVTGINVSWLKLQTYNLFFSGCF